MISTTDIQTQTEFKTEFKTQNDNQKDLYLLVFSFICYLDDEEKLNQKAFLVKCTEEQAAKYYAAYAAKELGRSVRGYITDMFSGAWDDPAADHYYRQATDKEINQFIYELKTQFNSPDDINGYEKFDFKKWKSYNVPISIFDESIEFKYD